MGSILEGNINYFPHGDDEDAVLFHCFVNVNTTGDVQSSVQPPHGLNGLSGMSCVDVPLETGQYPSVIGVWAYYANNQTFTGCKDSIAANSALDNCVYNVTHT